MLKPYLVGHMSPLFCSEDGIGGRDVNTGWITVPGTQIQFYGRLRYSKFPFYYNLFAEAGYTPQNSGVAQLWVTLQPVFYKPRCRDSVGPYDVTHYTNQPPHSFFSYLKYQSYQGSRALHAIHFKAQFSISPAGRSTWGSSPNLQSNWIEIRDNC